MKPNYELNENDVLRTYKILGHRHNEWTELRVFPENQPPVREWVNNEHDFLEFCRKWNGKVNIYAGLNPRPELGASGDECIKRICAIPIDIDPEREKNTASTEQELEQAQKDAVKILEWFKQQGLKNPIVALSGNGYHIIALVDIPVDNPKEFGKKISTFYQKLPVKVDPACRNPERIFKVYGTWSVKGEHSEERPHRLTKIITTGDFDTDEKLEHYILRQKNDSETNINIDEYNITDIYETQRKIESALRNERIKDLFNGDWRKYDYKSRSEAEYALVSSLFYYGLTPSEIPVFMSDCKIGKWQEEKDSYHKTTIENAYKNYLKNPNRFFTGTDFIPKRLSDEILREHKFLATSEKSDLWVYNKQKGIWTPDGITKLQKITTDKLKNKWKNHYTNEVEKHIRYNNYHRIQDLGGPINKFVVKNGVYNIDEDKLEDFNPDEKYITAIPATYDPEKDCPKFKKFLSEVVKPEDVDKIFEVIGYCLYKSYPLARIFIFTGTGRNGKSVLINVITNLLGKENISSVDIQNLTDDSFRSAELYGKLANINGDLPAKPIKDTGLIKKCTGQDPLTVAKKHKDPFQFINYAKLIFSANDVPKTYDNSDAMHRRLDVIEFPNKFDPDDPKTDPNLIDKITTSDELSGILNEAINGLRQLLKNGRFTNEKDIETRKIDYIKRSDPVHYFGLKYLTQNTDPEHFIVKKNLYDHYVFMCRSMGVIPTNSTWFGRNIRRYVPFIDEGWVGKETVWRGASVDLDGLQRLSSENGLDKVLTKTTKTKQSNIMVDTETVETGNKKDIKNSLGSFGRVSALQEKLDEALSWLNNGVSTPEELAEKMCISVSGADGLLATLHRDGVAFFTPGSGWRPS